MSQSSMSTPLPPQNGMAYGLKPDAFDIALPFHIICDRSLMVIQVGSSLQRLFPALQGTSLAESFALRRPALPLTGDILADHCHTLVLLEALTSSLKLKGQMILLEEGIFGFLGSPWITDIFEIEPMALSLSDFALHEPIGDYLLLLQSKQTALQDTRRLAEKLQAKQATLRATNQELQHEIAERIRIEAALAQARDQALEASRLKSEFLATISHEIRTPMNGIIGMSEMLLYSNLEPEEHEYAKIVHQEAENLLMLLNDILDFSKIEAGKLLLETQPLSPTTLLDSVVQLFEPKATQKGLTLTAYIDVGLPDMLLGDNTRIRQILLNLLSNAIKFTETGTIQVEFARGSQAPRMSTNEVGSRTNQPKQEEHTAQNEHNDEQKSLVPLQITVCDSGIGMSTTSQHNLFQPFMQADGSTTRKYGGTGLGLAITKRLVDLMQGTIAVQSTLGQGSTFIVCLPLPLPANVRHGHGGRSLEETYVAQVNSHAQESVLTC